MDLNAISEWMATHGQQEDPDAAKLVIKRRERHRCDSCKKFLSLFNAHVTYSDVVVHLDKKCLKKFRLKHLDRLEFHKTYRGTGYYD